MRRRGLIALVLLVAALAAFNYWRPVPAVAAQSAVPSQTTIGGMAPAMPWPKVGAAAVGASGLGFIAASGTDSPVPTASVAKVMTALLVLEDKPLNPEEQGPAITINDDDVQQYQADRADQQSVVAVQTGEQLSERQALEALLIPSANNIAYTLAKWSAGSPDAFVIKMNARAKALGMTRTTFADPAGSSPQTVSTPSDLVTLGITAMKLPTLAQVVSMPSAVLPVAGTVFNVDYVLGQSGIIGIKTGSGLNSGANFLFAATINTGGHVITLFGCVMGQPSLDAAFTAAKVLIAAMQPSLKVQRVVSRNEPVGSYDPPWGGHSDLVSTVDVDLVEWPGMVLLQKVDAPAIAIDAPLPPGTAAGKLSVILRDYRLEVPLATDEQLYPPGRLWRLTRLG